jgi:hypothetical protein
VLPVAVLGFVVAVLTVPAGDLAVKAFGGALVGVASSVLVRELHGDRVALPRVAETGLAVSLALVAAIGVRALVGEGAVLLVVLLVGLTAPGAVRAYALLLDQAGRPPGFEVPDACPAPAGTSPLVTAVAVDRLSDDELAAAWYVSCRALEQDQDPDRRLGWVLARQVYLDEFQRRSPETFDRWLAETAGTTERSRLHFPRRS